MNRLIPLALCLLVLAGCGNETPAVNDETSLVPALDFTFDHPSDLVLESESEGRVRYCFFTELESRSSRCVSFSLEGDFAESEKSQVLELTSGGSLTYGVDSKPAVGSGGVEHFLIGEVRLESDVSDSDPIYVRANANEDAGNGDATWVLPIVEPVRR